MGPDSRKTIGSTNGQTPAGHRKLLADLPDSSDRPNATDENGVNDDDIENEEFGPSGIGELWSVGGGSLGYGKRSWKEEKLDTGLEVSEEMSYIVPKAGYTWYDRLIILSRGCHP